MVLPAPKPIRPRPRAMLHRSKALFDLRDEFLRDLLEDMWKSLLENLLERRALAGLDSLAKSTARILRRMGSEFLLEAAVRDHFVDDGLIRRGSKRFEIYYSFCFEDARQSARENGETAPVEIRKTVETPFHIII